MNRDLLVIGNRANKTLHSESCGKLILVWITLPAGIRLPI
jgi:hypothetical protein